MPEGDTVWAAAQRLDHALNGQTLIRTDFRVPRYATVDLSSRTVTGVAARGKHLLIRVGSRADPDGSTDDPGGRTDDPGQGTVTIHSHLKMEGSWHIYAPGQKWRKPAFTARVVLTTAGCTAVGFSLGILELLASSDEERAVGHLGPDLLGADWDADEAVRRLQSAPERAIGMALLDQRNLAGIGNIYRNELCFLAGVHPATPVGQVPRLESMTRTARRLLQANRDRKVRNTTGFAAAGTGRMWVYRRNRQPCHRCGTLIKHGRLGDATMAARDIYFCPFCQRPSGTGTLDTSGLE